MLEEQLLAAREDVADRPRLGRWPAAQGVRLARRLQKTAAQADVMLGPDVLEHLDLSAGDRIVYEWKPPIAGLGDLVLSITANLPWPKLRFVERAKSGLVTLGRLPETAPIAAHRAEPCRYTIADRRLVVHLPLWFHTASTSTPAEIEWTDEMRAALVRRVKDGETRRAIAQSYGVTTGTIGWQLSLAGYVETGRTPRQRLREAELKSKVRTDAVGIERRCMSCGDPFISEGSHNRMCTTCRRLSDGLPDQFSAAGGGRWGGWRMSSSRS